MVQPYNVLLRKHRYELLRKNLAKLLLLHIHNFPGFSKF